MKENCAKAAIKAKRLEKNVTICRGRGSGEKESDLCGRRLKRKSSVDAGRSGDPWQLLDLDQESTASLSRFPGRADFPNMSDPFKYRLLEVIGVYGDACGRWPMKCSETASMSAIDFSLDMEKVKGSQGEDRCKITLNGKWLEYKTF